MSWSTLSARTGLRRCIGVPLILGVSLLAACNDPVDAPPPEPLPPRRGVTGISVSPQSASLAVGDTLRFRAVTTLGTGQDTTVIWTINRPEVVRIDSLSGLVRALAPGWATVIVTLRGNVNYKAGAQLTVTAR